MITLTPEQERAIAAVRTWRNTPGAPLFWLTGFAGTGKSTVAQYAADGGAVAFLAPTGKAASVLRRKGCVGASTIHRVLYRAKARSSTVLERLTAMLAHAHTPTERAVLQKQLADEARRLAQPAWEYNEETWLRQAALVVVDEASMVSERVLKDLLRTVPKVLCLGDPAQLPPVMATSPLLKRPPDFHLSQIHRHAADSDVLRAATHVRTHGVLPRWKPTADYRVVEMHETTWDDYRVPDQVLVASNATRQAMNRRFRARLNYTDLLSPGERVVVLRNSYEEGLYNGTTATVTSAATDFMFPNTAVADLLSDEGPAPNVSVLVSEEPTEYERGSVPLTYGYALTVHKAQGSEWDHVLVWLEGRAASPSWLYTALTRASQRLTVVVQ